MPATQPIPAATKDFGTLWAEAGSVVDTGEAANMVAALKRDGVTSQETKAVSDLVTRLESELADLDASSALYHNWDQSGLGRREQVAYDLMMAQKILDGISK